MKSYFWGGKNKKKRCNSFNCISIFVRRMRLELTRPCDHYPLKVACIPISPPAQGLLKKSERKTGLEPATPTLARLCSTNWAISAKFCKFCEIFISHLRMQSYVFFLIWPNVFVNIFVDLIIVLIISWFYFGCSLKNDFWIFEIR